MTASGIVLYSVTHINQNLYSANDKIIKLVKIFFYPSGCFTNNLHDFSAFLFRILLNNRPFFLIYNSCRIVIEIRYDFIHLYFVYNIRIE